MKLYYSPGACSLSPHIAFREAGLPVELEKVDLRAGTTESGTAYATVNPKGYVPALRLEDGQVITEGPVIVQLVADLAQDHKLAPEPGSFDRYRLQEWLGYINSELHKSFGPLFNKASSDDAKGEALKKIDKRLRHAAESLKKTPYLMGDHFSVADGYLYVILRWAKAMKVELPEAGVFDAFVKRMQGRDGVKLALKEEGLEPI